MITTQDQENLRRAMGEHDPPLKPFDPDPIRRSYKLMLWVVLAFLILGGISIARAVFAAENPPPRVWVVWDLDADKPWLSKKTGLPATATGPTACSMSLHEVSKAAPSGSRLACRQRKEQ